MLPCPAPQTLKKKEDDKGENHSKLLWFEHRFLSGGETSSTQCKEGYEELISAEALHQLHILIFFLAIFHVLYVQNLSFIRKLEIYVVERSQDCDPSDFMEFFDPKTGIWEKAPSPGGEIRRSWTYISGSFALEGNLHVVGDKLHKNVVYKPKENKWDTVGFRKCLGSGSKSSCVIDNVTYCYTHEPSRNIEIKWYSKERSSGRALKGLETLPKLPKEYDDCVRLESYGGKLAVLWEENVRSFGSTSTKKKMIWCAVIAIERRNNVHEVFGKVEWCDVVLRVPKSCYLEHLVLTSV